MASKVRAVPYDNLVFRVIVVLRELQQQMSAVVAALEKVTELVGKHFRLVGDPSDGRLGIASPPAEPSRDDPLVQLRHKLDAAQHDLFARQLRELIDDAWKAFKKYRQTVKGRLRA